MWNKKLPPYSDWSSSTLKNGAARNSETFVTTDQSTRRHIPGRRNLDIRYLLTRWPSDNHCQFFYKPTTVLNNTVSLRISKFKVSKSVHHHTFRINQPSRRNKFSSLLLDVYSYVQLNMFRASSRPSSGVQQLRQQPVFLLLKRGGGSSVGRGRAGRPAGPTTTNSTAITKLRRQTRGCYCNCCSSWWWAWGCQKHVELYIRVNVK